MSVNFHGVINTVGAFLPLMRETEGRRHIALTASASFLQIGIRMAAYVASKFAVVGMVKCCDASLQQRTSMTTPPT
jgi:NAD(P)-dependent dehydrogenase (short-subunit alcohol dehydrogenase family)